MADPVYRVSAGYDGDDALYASLGAAFAAAEDRIVSGLSKYRTITVLEYVPRDRASRLEHKPVRGWQVFRDHNGQIVHLADEE